MDFFQVFNINTKSWVDSNIKGIVPGWTENWVLDKTTDSASIKIKYNGLTLPNWNKGDWCRIIHANTAVATYNEDGTPLNHTQYIIDSFQVIEDNINEELDIQIKIIEPIEITKGILVDTRSFTNQTSKKDVSTEITYIQDPLNHYSVLERILRTTPLNCDDETYADENLWKAKAWWWRIDIRDTELLQSISFNDDSYAEPSLYNILMDKYDSTTKRTPVLYFNINTATDKPNRINDFIYKPNYFLKFERQDGFDKSDIQMTDMIDGCNSIIWNKSAENFTDGIVSNINNIIPEISSYYNATTSYAFPEYISDDRAIGSKTDFTDGNWVLKTPHNIKRIKSIQHLRCEFNGDTSFYSQIITDFDNILEEKQYIASDLYKTTNVIWYKEGENIIHLNNYINTFTMSIGKSITDLYKIEYDALMSLRYDLGEDYQIQINQTDSQVDAYRYSEYLKEYLKSMNKTDLIIYKTIESFDDILEIGSRVIDGNKTYLITNISITNRNMDYDVIYQLNENHFRRNDSIVSPQNIRENIAISLQASKERKSMLNETTYIDFMRPPVKSYENQFIIPRHMIYSTIITNIASGYGLTDNLGLSSEVALMEMYSKLKDASDTIYNVYENVMIPINKSVINNTFIFNIKFLDNALAGKKKIRKEGTDTYLSELITYKGGANEQLPILYTDIFGQIDKVYKLIFANLSLDVLTNLSVSGTDVKTNLDSINPIIDKLALLPTPYIAWSNYNQIFEIDNINYYKDMLDTFNISIGLTIKNSENIKLCKAFFDNSLFYGGTMKIDSIETFDHNIAEEDFANETHTKTNIISSTLYDSSADSTEGFKRYIEIGLSSTITTPKCIVLTSGTTPLVIFNDFDKVADLDFDWGGKIFNGNTIKFYC